MRVVAAPDKLKGTASAAVVAEAVAEAVRLAGGSCDRAPMADGGEGTLEVLGGANRTAVVSGPLGDLVTAGFRLVGRSAVVEMAQASGLALVGGAEGNDAVAASTYGTGELIGAALDAGARRVVIGVGGSATTDGGFGALRALYPTQRLRGVDLVVACDVHTRFLDAAEVFAPQKGASPAQVRLLRGRLERLAADYEEQYGIDVTDLPGGGAAGGLAGGLAAVGAELVSGFDLLAEEVELYERLTGADLAVTGEGFVDAESFDGKVVGGVVSYAADLGIPVLVVAGEVFHDEVAAPLDATGAEVSLVSLSERFGRERSLAEPAACVAEAVAEHLASR